MLIYAPNIFKFQLFEGWRVENGKCAIFKALEKAFKTVWYSEKELWAVVRYNWTILKQLRVSVDNKQPPSKCFNSLKHEVFHSQKNGTKVMC